MGILSWLWCPEPRYQAGFAPAVATSLKYFGSLVDSVLSVREASAAAWLSAPVIHAFFCAAVMLPR
ncbi:MAG TPA: hypothetical protein VEC35_01510 [Noviherbaspirillum sp.]|nr:hypothetical protein [Noviherbaspirillum sp.]